MKKNISCLCGTNIAIDYDEDIDIDNNPKVLKEIFDGTFMSYKCDFCGKKHKPEFKILIFWKTKNLKMEVYPELDRGEFYRNKKDVSSFETVIGFPEMADRLAVVNDGLEPVIIETLKSYLLAKAEENYPDRDIGAWYHCKNPLDIEFHLSGIKYGEVAVMKIPTEIYEKTHDDYVKHPKNGIFPSLRIRSYLSVQNLLRNDALK
ncbi:MAG: CpXC domain-containing protein [Treponema sp.]|nr:CpXC domain-containing protein [Treponema sp.]